MVTYGDVIDDVIFVYPVMTLSMTSSYCTMLLFPLESLIVLSPYSLLNKCTKGFQIIFRIGVLGAVQRNFGRWRGGQLRRAPGHLTFDGKDGLSHLEKEVV